MKMYDNVRKKEAKCKLRKTEGKKNTNFTLNMESKKNE